MHIIDFYPVLVLRCDVISSPSLNFVTYMVFMFTCVEVTCGQSVFTACIGNFPFISVMFLVTGGCNVMSFDVWVWQYNSLWHSPGGSFVGKDQEIYHWYEFQKCCFKITATYLRGQWVNFAVILLNPPLQQNPYIKDIVRFYHHDWSNFNWGFVSIAHMISGWYTMFCGIKYESCDRVSPECGC